MVGVGMNEKKNVEKTKTKIKRNLDVKYLNKIKFKLKNIYFIIIK